MSSLDAEIRKNRVFRATLNLSHQGKAVAGRDVTVAQKSHQFLFGSNWGESAISLANGELLGREKELAEQRNEHFLRLFNQATLPFYWARFEPRRGQPDTRRIMNTARWYAEQGCALKGHPLCWHTLTAPWLLEMSNEEILEAQLARIRRDVTDFAGVIETWDVVNEAVIMPIFDKYDNGITRLCKQMGRIGLIRAMFEASRAANPSTTLILNDFDISPAYDLLVEECLAAGIQIDVIGIQSHMHQGYWGAGKTLEVLQRFERFNLPIQFSETTIISGHLMPPEIVDLNDYQVDEWPSDPEGEQRQAEEVVTHYKTLLSRPLVTGITWWDMTDGGWLKAPAGLLRRDQTPKPAYHELLKLVKGEWWLSPTRMTTDSAGQLTVEGFPGQYELALDTRKVSFSLDAQGEPEIFVNL